MATTTAQALARSAQDHPGVAERAPRPAALPYAALVVGAISLGFSAIFVRWAEAPGTVTAFYRLAVAALVLAWPTLLRIRSLGTEARATLGIAAAGGLLLGTDMALWATGVMMSGATNPTLLANTAPLWVGLGAWIFFRERLGLMFWLGIVLALAGAAVILGLDSLRAASFGAGSLFGLFAGMFYGAYFLVTQRGRRSLDTVTYLGVVAAAASLGLLLLNLALGQQLTGYSLKTYLALLALGLGPQVIGYLALNYSLGHLPASLVAPTMLAQPVLTAVFALLLLGEPLSAEQIAGGVAVLAGVFVVHRFRARQGGR